MKERVKRGGMSGERQKSSIHDAVRWGFIQAIFLLLLCWKTWVLEGQAVITARGMVLES